MQNDVGEMEVFVAPPSDISTDVPIPVRPLSERLIGSVDDSAWEMSKLIISDPKLNALSQSNGRISGKFETGISVAEMFASFGTPQLGESLHAIPNIRTPVFNPSNREDSWSNSKQVLRLQQTLTQDSSSSLGPLLCQTLHLRLPAASRGQLGGKGNGRDDLNIVP